MSSSSRLLRDRRRVLLTTALIAAVCLLQWFGATAVGAAQLDVVTVFPPAADGQVTLVADVWPASAGPLPSDAFSVATGAVTLPSRAAPVVSDQLAVGLVVDGSAEGAAVLHQGLSGAADILLAMPVAARMSAVADTSPPRVLSPLRRGAKDALRALDRFQPAGARNTAHALSLALRQLPSTAQAPRVVLLLTGARDAGGADPAVLADEFRKAHALLAVVSTAADTSYWARLIADTGGVLAAPQSGNLLTAFETVAETLRSRYVLTFPAPEQLPGRVAVRVRTAAGTLSANVFVGGPSAPATPATGGWSSLLRVLAIVLAVVAVPVVATALLRARRPSGSGGGTRPTERGLLPPSRVEPAAEPPLATAGEPADGERPRLQMAQPPVRPAVPRPAEIAAAGPRDATESPGAEPSPAAWPPAAEAATGAEPRQAQPQDARPQDIQPGDAQPDEAQPQDTQPGNAQPQDAQRGDAEPGEAQPGDTQPGEGQPQEIQPGEAQPGEGQPQEIQPGDTQPGEGQPQEIQPGEAQPQEIQPGDAQPGEAQPPDVRSRPAASAERPTADRAEPVAGTGEDEAASPPQAAEPPATGTVEPPATATAPARRPGQPVRGSMIPAGVGPAGETTVYAHLDAQAADAVAEVQTGRLDRRQAVARIALAAPGRIDLFDRLIDAERRLAGAQLTSQSYTETLLDLLAAARRVVGGDAMLNGPGGIRVEQAVPPGADPVTRTVLRVTRKGRLIRDCRTTDELARHVDLSTLQADPDPPRSATDRSP